MCLVRRGFHLNRQNFGFAREEEINLIIVIPASCGPGMIVKFFKSCKKKKKNKRVKNVSGRSRPLLSRIGTMCRSREKRADASLGIGDDNTFARKGFFSEIHIVENKHAKLK